MVSPTNWAFTLFTLFSKKCNFLHESVADSLVSLKNQSLNPQILCSDIMMAEICGTILASRQNSPPPPMTKPLLKKIIFFSKNA